jgi:hypothetical protein
MAQEYLFIAISFYHNILLSQYLFFFEAESAVAKIGLSLEPKIRPSNQYNLLQNIAKWSSF